MSAIAHLQRTPRIAKNVILSNILFCFKCRAKILLNEHHRSVVRPKLTLVAMSKILKNCRFFKKNRKSIRFRKKKFFIETLRGTTAASFCRMKLLRCSFVQELPILCVKNKIKSPRSFYTAQHMSHLPRKNPFWYGFRKVVCSVKSL